MWIVPILALHPGCIFLFPPVEQLYFLSTLSTGISGRPQQCDVFPSFSTGCTQVFQQPWNRLTPLANGIRELLYLVIYISLGAHELLDLRRGMHDGSVVSATELITDLGE